MTERTDCEACRELERVQRLLVTTGVRPLVDRVVGLEDVPAALGDLAEGRVRGKIVVRVA